MNMADYYAQLIGVTITGVRMEPDAYGAEPFPTFTARAPDGEVFEIALSRDPEGNGGGFAFISKPTECEVATWPEDSDPGEVLP